MRMLNPHAGFRYGNANSNWETKLDKDAVGTILQSKLRAELGSIGVDVCRLRQWSDIQDSTANWSFVKKLGGQGASNYLCESLRLHCRMIQMIQMDNVLDDGEIRRWPGVITRSGMSLCRTAKTGIAIIPLPAPGRFSYSYR